MSDSGELFFQRVDLLKVTTVGNQLFEDVRLSWEAAHFYMVAAYYVERGVEVTKDLMVESYKGGMGKRMYLRCTRELEELGYLIRHRTRGECGRFGKVAWELTLPPMEHERMSKSSYLQEIGAMQNPRSTPQSRFAPMGAGEPIEIEKSQVSTRVTFCANGDAETAKPQVSSRVTKRARGASDSHKTKQEYYTFDDVGTTKDVIAREDDDGDSSRLVSFAAAQEHVAKSDGYVLANVCEDTVQWAFGQVLGKCSDLSHLSDQLRQCRPEVDAMYGPPEGCGPICGADLERWVKTVSSALSSVASEGGRTKKLPVYWFKDYGGEVRKRAIFDWGFRSGMRRL